MATRILIALLALLLPGTVLRAQTTDPLVEAMRKYNRGNSSDLAGARAAIDRAVATEEYANDPEAWLLRGYVYKDVFKAMPGGDEADALREEAFTSLRKSMELDKGNDFRKDAVQCYEFMARSYFNDAGRALADMREERAQHLFRHYQEAMYRLDPKADLGSRRVEFNNALGTLYTRRFSQDRTATEWFDKAVATYKAVLAIDPDNYGATYNLATLYYNRGVYNIQRLNPDHGLTENERLQEESREFFRQSLPYMLRAHTMNSARPEPILGLEGIYYSLQDQENSDKYRKLFEALPPQEEPDR